MAKPSIDQIQPFVEQYSSAMADQDQTVGRSNDQLPTLEEILPVHVGDGQVGDDGDVDVVEHVVDVQEVIVEGGSGLLRRRPASFVLSFVNLTYCVKTPVWLCIRRRRKSSATNPVTAAAEQQSVHRDISGGETRKLLDSISGEVKEGEILAVMGASGSGKSTLIDALANRIARGSLEGSIFLNGQNLDGRTLKAISAYVMQDDLLFPMLTVEETLAFAAEFRLPRSLSASKKKARVKALIDQLGLRSAANTIIGDEGHRGISGGERRRVSIGTDIIHDPILLFLDEPTSGLDSTSAFMVVKVLQRIAQSGSIVIMSIHQPSYRIVGLLDHLIFLSRGQMVYSGPPDNLPAFLAEFGHPIPEEENWTEFILDIVGELEDSPTGTKPLIDFNKSWQATRSSQRLTAAGGTTVSLKEAIRASIARGKLVSDGATGTGTSSASSSSAPMFANPFWTEVAVLTRRSFTNTRRMPELFYMRLGTVFVTGFILATLFWRLSASPKGVQERLGFFAFSMSTMFYTCADALPVFLQERYIFMRETAYNAYRRSSYVFANAAVGFPPLVFLSVTFAATTFFAVGLAGGSSGFVFYFLIVLASFWAGSGFVTFISGVVSHVMLGYTVAVALLAYFLLFSGFFINRNQIPSYWIWFHYLSLVKYPYEAVLHNEFGEGSKCFTRGLQVFDETPLGVYPPDVKMTALAAIAGVLKVNLTGETCMTTGPDVLKQQGVAGPGKWEDLLVTVAWGFFFRALFYFALQLGSKNKRR